MKAKMNVGRVATIKQEMPPVTNPETNPESNPESVEIRQETFIPITDDFMFGKVMENPEIYRQALEIILGEPIDKVISCGTQETMKEYVDSHGIRMDAYMQSDISMYNTEMQVAKITELKFRSRYNGSMMDVNDLKPGMHYNAIRNSFVIFICGFDPFGRGEYKYKFITKDVENGHLNLDEGVTKIFINLKGKHGNVSKELKELINYMAGRKSAHQCTLELIKEIDEIVNQVNEDKIWRKERMKLQREMMMCEARGREVGVIIGEAREEARGIQLLIQNMCSAGIAIDEVIQRASDSYGKSISEIKEIIDMKMAV